MWNGKKKAVTFSYDDGVTQDRRLVEMEADGGAGIPWDDVLRRIQGSR